MRSFIAIVGMCLTATVACAADRPDDRDAGPAWPNPSTAAPAVKPKVVEYGAAAVNVLRSAVTELPPPNQAPAAPDPAPDPPPVTNANAAPAVFEPDRAAPSVRLAAATEPVREEAKPQTAAATPAPTSAHGASAAPLTLGGHADKGAAAKTSSLTAMFTVGGSLSIVLGLFLFVAWAMRKTAPRGSLALPKEVFEILGRASLGSRQQVQLLRCGNKMLLVSITPHGTETLTEVTDPLEVDRIAGLCQQANPKSSTTAFRQVFQQLATKSGDAAESGSTEVGGLRRKRYRWEEKHA